MLTRVHEQFLSNTLLSETMADTQGNPLSFGAFATFVSFVVNNEEQFLLTAPARGRAKVEQHRSNCRQPIHQSGKTPVDR